MRQAQGFISLNSPFIKKLQKGRRATLFTFTTNTTESWPLCLTSYVQFL